MVKEKVLEMNPSLKELSRCIRIELVIDNFINMPRIKVEEFQIVMIINYLRVNQSC